MKKKNHSSVKTKSVGNRGLSPHAKIPGPKNYRRFSFSSVNVTVSYDVLSRDNYCYHAFAFLITRFRFLVTVSSKGTTNEYTYKRQCNYSRHVHEL